MKRTKTFYLFLSVLLLGYCCQVSRFQSAQFSSTGVKALTKNIFACQHQRTAEKQVLIQKRSAAGQPFISLKRTVSFSLPRPVPETTGSFARNKPGIRSPEDQRGPPHSS